MVNAREEQKLLEKFMWLSIAASIVVIALKLTAAWVTGSVGFLSDAIESVINLVAAAVGLWALKLAAKPADHNHNFGHARAEYFSAQVEGSLILVASVVIIWTSIDSIINPQPLEQLGVGLVFSVIATIVNAAVGIALIRAGKKYRSTTSDVDGRHLMTSVRTTAAGRQRFVNLVMQVPGSWTVDASHDHADRVEEGVASVLGSAETIIHVEPLGHQTTTGQI